MLNHDENAPGRGILALGHPAQEPETAQERKHREAIERENDRQRKPDDTNAGPEPAKYGDSQ